MTQPQPTTQAVQLGEMLTLEQQFRQEHRSLPRLGDDQERLLVERARSGDIAARDALMMSLMPSVKAFVHRFLTFNYEDITSQWEAMDLVQEGAAAMLEAFDRARSRECTPGQAHHLCASILDQSACPTRSESNP